MKQNLRITPRSLAITGLIAGVICIAAPLTIPLPFSPVPLSLANLAFFFAILLFGWKKAMAGCMIYLLLGLVGLPVFSGFTSGPGKLFGPTGGYLIGYLFMIPAAGLILRLSGKRQKPAISAASLIISNIVLYIFGSFWLSYQAELSLGAALLTGVLPYIPGDLLKIAAAVITTPKLKKRLGSYLFR